MLRVHQTILIAATVLLSWLAMQAVHEFGHVFCAWWTGGSVARVVLHPLTISRTDLAVNPHPLLVAWAGPTVGVVAPLVMWAVVFAFRCAWGYLFRFFAGFCLIANGAYIGAGSVERVGDAGEMLRHGSPAWQLWVFGLVTVPVGLLLWHRLGKYFGLGPAKREVSVNAAYCCLSCLIGIVVLELALPA